MFELLKKDIRIGDTIKLYLTTGKEPEGIVIEIGDNYILLKTDNNKTTRYFDKIIGGWDVIEKKKIKNIDKNGNNEFFSQNTSVDKVLLLDSLKLLIDTLDKYLLSTFIEPNANIYEVRGTTCLASNDEYSKILILNNTIVDQKLVDEIESFKIGSIVPVWLQYYSKKENEAMATVAIKPNTIEETLSKIKQLIQNEEYQQTKMLLWILKPHVKRNKYLGNIIRELKKINIPNNNPKKINIQYTDDPDERKQYKSLEKQINSSIRNSNFEEALYQIELEIKKDIPDKYVSSLLLKKAQIYSSLNQPDNSEKAYQDLVEFNVSIKSPANNLSHLYTELARLQALNSSKLKNALENVKKALDYNPANNYASNLLKKIEAQLGSVVIKKESDDTNEEYLVIDSTEDTTTISKLIDIDIQEHKFSHPEILKNGGKPTAFLASLILEQAKKNRDIDIAERYPTYLEAAKAFSVLNIGSYDIQDYLESVAYYSMLKGNSLYISFRTLVLNEDIDITKLTRLKDSASSYYIEALNLLSNIEPKSLLIILANYLKLNIVTYHVNKKADADFGSLFKGQFYDVFSFCFKNKDKEIEKIAYKTIVEIGAASINAWNKLASLPKGTGGLYNQFFYSDNRIRIFGIINEINESNISVDLKTTHFLKETFLKRIQSKNQLNSYFGDILRIHFEAASFKLIDNAWNKLNNYNFLFNDTDIETKTEIEKLISILQPYLNRNETERTNILLQVRRIIERQLNFIDENTTYYGRALFYNILNKWKNEIDELLEVKIAETLPALIVQIDPPYYIKTNNEYFAPIIVSNDGETTSEGFKLSITYESPEYEYEEEIKATVEIKDEIPSGTQIETNISIPSFLIDDYKAVEITFNLKSIYQGKEGVNKQFKYTLEEEPKSNLLYEDIPWKDGPVPPEHMFKGRKGLISDLAHHYLSTERTQPYILYGLTRTGKSSILKYLRKDLQEEIIHSNGTELKILTFEWEFQELSNSSNAREFYQALLYESTFLEIEKYKRTTSSSKININVPEDKTQFKHLKILIEHLNSNGFFPMFFIDELSYIKDLIDKGTIGTAFLAALRQYSLDGKASFIFAGTYDIKKLITDKNYGITGQFVHAIEYQVDRIKDQSAEELINVINDKLTFTQEAIEQIKFLSGNIPYFIQIVCKSCGDYAVENNRRFIGYPELEKVVRILTGKDECSSSLVKRLPPGKFQNNQYSPTDPKEVSVLISSLTHFNKDTLNPRGIGIHELEKLWNENKLISFKAKLATSLEDLLEKKILYQEEDEGLPVYKFSVDIFRRWWYNQHQDISLELTTLTIE